MLMQLKPGRHGSDRDVHSLMSADGVRVTGSRVQHLSEPQASPGQGQKVRPPSACPRTQDFPSQKPGAVDQVETDVIHLHPAQSHRWGKLRPGEKQLGHGQTLGVIGASVCKGLWGPGTDIHRGHGGWGREGPRRPPRSLKPSDPIPPTTPPEDQPHPRPGPADTAGQSPLTHAVALGVLQEALQAALPSLAVKGALGVVAQGAGLAVVRAQLTLVHVCQRDQAARQGLAGTRKHIPATTLTLQRSPASRGAAVARTAVMMTSPLSLPGTPRRTRYTRGPRAGAKTTPHGGNRHGRSSALLPGSRASGFQGWSCQTASPLSPLAVRPQQVTVHPPPLPSTHSLQSAGLCPPPLAAAGMAGSFPR